VKDSRDGHFGKHSELRAIRETLGELPSHMKLLTSDATVSTFSLFAAMDYCITVRGTVGMEAACFGVPVLTAGTGRYDRLGFTIDFGTQEAYLACLSRLERQPPLTALQTELARRFAYGVFLARPLALQSIMCRHSRDAKASMSAKFLLDPSKDVSRAPDIATVTEWLESGEEDYLEKTAIGPIPFEAVG
jgi:hypothetical protein